MAAEKVQLNLHKNYGPGDEAKKVIQQEMAAVRKSTGTLPRLAAEKNAAIQTANSRVEGSMMGLPRVHGAMGDKMQSARRGAALANALGNAGLEKQLAKEEMEKKKRAARLKSLGRHSSQQAANLKAHGAEGGARNSRTGASTARMPSSRHPPPLDSSPSRRGQPSMRRGADAPSMSRAQSSRVPAVLSRAGTQRRNLRSGSMPKFGNRRYIGAFLDREEVHGIRDDSRVGRLLADFGGKDDWVSLTVLKHQMATILQANVRGWLLRLKWWHNPDLVVDRLHARMHADATEADRRAKLRRTLEIRSMTSKQKKTAANAVGKLFGARAMSLPSSTSGPRTAAARWGKLQKNADIAAQEMTVEKEQLEKAVEQGLDPNGLGDILGSDVDSEFSDLEMEDITAVKLRAKTPPWQRQEESQWAGQYNKLTRNNAHSSLEMRWDLDACSDRLEGCKARWRNRNQEQADEEAEQAVYDPLTQPLPPELISDLLYPKYVQRMVRLGLMEPEEVAGQEEETTPRSTGTTAALLPPIAAAPTLAQAPVPTTA